MSWVLTAKTLESLILGHRSAKLTKNCPLQKLIKSSNSITSTSGSKENVWDHSSSEWQNLPILRDFFIAQNLVKFLQNVEILQITKFAKSCGKIWNSRNESWKLAKFIIKVGGKSIFHWIPLLSSITLSSV